jgi:glucose/arabinose dehydrogenase
VLLQTAAPAVGAQPAAGPVRAIPVAQGLENPWAVAFLTEGRFLVTERPGRLRVVEADGRLNPPVAGLPPLAAGGQGGLLDVVLDSGFATNRTLYFCFTEAGDRRCLQQHRPGPRACPRTAAGWRTCA